MSKINSFCVINQMLQLEKLKGKKIVFACGCFDLLHYGHIEYLVGAKDFGDILVVGVNSDYSIERIKGRPPIFTSEQRSQVLSALACVDFVFIFDEDTVDKFLLELRPNVFAKGIDRIDYCAEMKTTSALGIQIEFIGESKRSSSSDILNKMFKRIEDRNGGMQQ
ncbi:Bifunctional protein HldE [compost metagenome]